MLEKLYNQIRSRIIASYGARKFIYNLLASPIFTMNPLYPYLFYKDIYKKVKCFDSKPQTVIIENTNLCNISCVFCINEQMKRKRGFINNDLFRKIIEQCAYYKISNVYIQGFGEPLLDRDYARKVAYAKQRGIESVCCITNAILLNKYTSEMLIKSGLDYIHISIDAATPQVYGQIHRVPGSGIPSDKFPTVVENIDNLIELKKKYKSKKPFIEVRFKDFDKNKSDLARFIKKYKGRVDNVVIYMNIISWPGSNIKNNLPNKRVLRFPCYSPWLVMFIMHDGRVGLCCQDYECRVELGDTNKEDIMDIWHGKAISQIRRLHLENKFNQINVCSDCVINTHYVTCWWP